ncbi:unnamed protein product [Arctogadus glacialis]
MEGKAKVSGGTLLRSAEVKARVEFSMEHGQLLMQTHGLARNSVIFHGPFNCQTFLYYGCIVFLVWQYFTADKGYWVFHAIVYLGQDCPESYL